MSALMASLFVTRLSQADVLQQVGQSKAAGMEHCIAPTPFMRRNHMELIKHQRIETVRHGVRATDKSLAGCVDCHANKKPDGSFVPVDEPKQFCTTCHQKVGMVLNCFDCHSTVPGNP